MKTAKTKYLGCCQICEGEFKIQNGLTSTHGYTRPGHGYIVGLCGGAKELPYETSCELIKSYLVGLKAMLERTKERVVELQSPTLQYFSRTEMDLWTRSMKTTEYAVGLSDKYAFADALKSLVYKMTNQVKAIEFDIVRLTKRIETWELKAVREVV